MCLYVHELKPRTATLRCCARANTPAMNRKGCSAKQPYAAYFIDKRQTLNLPSLALSLLSHPSSQARPHSSLPIMSAGCVVAAAVCAKVLQERPQLLRLLLLRLPLLLQIFCKQTKGGGFVCIFSVCECVSVCVGVCVCGFSVCVCVCVCVFCLRLCLLSVSVPVSLSVCAV